MKIITVHVPEPYIRALDRLVEEKMYPNRAEAIRMFIHDGLHQELWNKNMKEGKMKNDIRR